LQHEQEREGVTLTPKQYRKGIEDWKEFQADNIAKSTIVSTSSIAFNVATQKMMGNTHKIWVITLAKLAGAAITVAAMLGVRFALPRTTQGFDDELSRRYFSPLVRKTQKLMGAEVDEKPQQHRHHEEHREKSHSARIEAARSDGIESQYGR
jgi:hypothetical protein